MRIFIITIDEPVYAPVYLTKIVDKVDQSVVGVTALSPAGRLGRFGFARQRLQMYGAVDFFRAASLYGRCWFRDKLPVTQGQERLYSVRRVASVHSIPVYQSTAVNQGDYLELLRTLRIDLLISVSANQRFGTELLRIPRLACLNVHSALLPNYRGIDGLFWALVHGEREVGVTVHVMTEGFDEGAIVAQRSFEVERDDTLHRLYFKAIEVGSDLLAYTINQYALGAVTTRVNDKSAGSYFSWPTREAAAEFRRRGRKFF